MAAELLIRPSAHNVAATVGLLTAELRRRNIAVFAVVDHAAGAREVGLELADEVLLIFGSPAVGTALMQADPRAGLDLPLRLLVWEQGGRTQVAFRSPRALADDHALAGQGAALDKLKELLEQLAVLIAPP